MKSFVTLTPGAVASYTWNRRKQYWFSDLSYSMHLLARVIGLIWQYPATGKESDWHAFSTSLSVLCQTNQMIQWNFYR